MEAGKTQLKYRLQRFIPIYIRDVCIHISVRIYAKVLSPEITYMRNKYLYGRNIFYIFWSFHIALKIHRFYVVCDYCPPASDMLYKLVIFEP